MTWHQAIPQPAMAMFIVEHKCTIRAPVHKRYNTLRPKQNGRRFADGTFKRIFLNENVRISIKISLKFVPEGPVNNPALVQIMIWRLSDDKPLSESMMVRLPTHICVTRPQWGQWPWLRSLLFWGAVDFDLQSQISLKSSNSPHF